MSQQLGLERMVADWMADEATGVPEDLADQVIAITSATQPAPRWMAVLQEPPMRVRSHVAVGIPRLQLALVGLLLLLGLSVAVGAVLTILRTQAPVDEWPGFRGDASRAGIAVNGPIGNPTIRWKVAESAGVSGPVAIAGGLVVVPTDDGVIHALAAQNGAERWSFTAAGPMHGPFVAAGRVHVADGDGVIHALSLADGNELWASASRVIGPSDLAVLDDRLYLGSGDGLVYAFDARTGAELWRSPVALNGSAVHAPSVSGETILAATDDDQLIALNVANGVVRWRRAVGSAGLGTPMAWNGLAYAGAGPAQHSGRLVAYDLMSGEQRWSVERNIYSPSIAGDVGYSGSADGIVTAIDLRSGAEHWTARLGGVVRPAVAAGGVVYLGVDLVHRVVGLDRATGGELWSRDVDGDVLNGVAVAQGLVVVGTATGSVYAIAGDGAQLTAKPPPSRSSISPSPAATSAPTAALLVPRIIWTASSGAADFTPWTLARAPDGRSWATEGLTDRFSIFTPAGTFVEAWGRSGKGDGQFDLTRANGDAYGNVTFGSDGSIYVLDVGNRRVQRFDADRKFLSAWGEFGTGPRQFIDPIGMAVDEDGNVNVLDDRRGVVETYTPDGRIVRTIGAFPPPVAPNNTANQLAIGPNRHLYISVTSPNEVIELDRQGTLIATIGGAGPGTFTGQPGAMAFDGAGRLYVAQGPERGRAPGIEIFAPDGRFLGGFGALGSGDADLGFPAGLVVADDGIYVSDAGGVPDVGLRSLIRKFAPIAFP